MPTTYSYRFAPSRVSEWLGHCTAPGRRSAPVGTLAGITAPPLWLFVTILCMIFNARRSFAVSIGSRFHIAGILGNISSVAFNGFGCGSTLDVC